MPLPPRKSVSLTLLRPGAEFLEVFWAQRRLDRRFLPGFHAFVAGSVEPHDPNDPTAALRETFEETGILLTHDDLQLVDLPHRTPQFFQNITPNLTTSRPVDLGWWRTPAWLQPSFLTHFFALLLTDEEGRLLDDLSGHLDPAEFIDGAWIPASEAIDLWHQGRAYLTTPISLILSALAGHSSHTIPEIPALGPTADSAPTCDAIEIAGHVHLLPLETRTLPPATHTNTIIAGHNDFVVIDPGPSEPEHLQPLINHLQDRRQQGHNLLGFILTHHHRDHIGGLTLLADHVDAPILAHPETLQRLPSHPFKVAPLEHNDTIPIDRSGPLTALHTPGHAPGHLAIHQPHTNLLFAGDLVASHGTIIIDPPDGHMGSYLNSLRSMRDLNPRAIIPSHGHLIVQPTELLNRYIDHRNQRESLVLQALKKYGPTTPEELVPYAYPEIPPSIAPLATRSLLAHLLHLVEQNQATVNDDDRFQTPAFDHPGKQKKR